MKLHTSLAIIWTCLYHPLPPFQANYHYVLAVETRIVSPVQASFCLCSGTVISMCHHAWLHECLLMLLPDLTTGAGWTCVTVVLMEFVLFEEKPLLIKQLGGWKAWECVEQRPYYFFPLRPIHGDYNSLAFPVCLLLLPQSPNPFWLPTR